MGVSKNNGTSKSSNFNRVGTIIFTIHFGGPPLFLETPTCFLLLLQKCTNTTYLTLDVTMWFIHGFFVLSFAIVNDCICVAPPRNMLPMICSAYTTWVARKHFL